MPEMPDQQAKSREFRDLMGHFCTGVTIVTGCLEGAPWGFTAQSFVALSLEPELIAVCPANSSDSWPSIARSHAFCVNFLKDTQADLSGRFAQTGTDKFDGIAWCAKATGSPVLGSSIAYVDCSLVREVEAGDHSIAIGKVEELGLIDSDASPLLFYRGAYRTLAVPHRS